MKMFSFSLSALLCCSLLANCAKNDDDTPTPVLTNEEAAELVESAVSGQSGGMSQSVSDLSDLAEAAPSIPCNVQRDTSFQHSRSVGNATFSAATEISYLLVCNNFSIPQSLAASLNGTQSCTSTRWQEQGTSEGQLSVSGIQPSASVYMIAGMYSWMGTATGQGIRKNRNFSVELSANLQNLTVRKSDNVIAGGTATFQITAIGTNGNSQTISGSLVFNGDGTVTVTVGNHTQTFPL